MALGSSTLGSQTLDAQFVVNQNLSCIPSSFIGTPRIIGTGFMIFFKPFRPEPFSWHMVILGDSSKIPWHFTQIWHTFRMEILFTLWKDRNYVLFNHNFLDVNIAMYTKACICNNVIMQIQVQANKVALEVAHL